MSIQSVADRLGMPGENAIKLADECACDGLVMHDQSQHTKADKRASLPPHSVTLAAPGWALARGDEQQTLILSTFARVGLTMGADRSRSARRSLEMDKLVSKEILLRQVDGLRDIARRARRLAEITDEPEQTRLIQCADDFEESAIRIEGEAATAKTGVMPQSASLTPKRRLGPNT